MRLTTRIALAASLCASTTVVAHAAAGGPWGRSAMASDGTRVAVLPVVDAQQPSPTLGSAPVPADLQRATEPERPPLTVTKAPAPSAQAQAVPAAPAAAPAGQQQGVTDRDITFGMTGPLSGPSKELGRQMRQGIETAFDVVNASGGIHGRQLRLDALDDGYEPARALQNVRDLNERDHVFGYMGNVGTPTAEATLPYALEHGLPFFGAFTGANLLRNSPPDRYVYNLRASYAEETEAVVHYLLKVRGIKPREIAVLAQDDGYGESGYAGVTKALRAAGGAYAEPLRMSYKRNTIDVAQAVAQLRASKGVKAVIMVASYRAAAKFIEAARAALPKLILSNVSFTGSTALADELNLLGPGYADGVIVTQVVPPVAGFSKAVLDYKAALAKYFPGEAPDYVSFEGYLDAKLMVEALDRSGNQPTTEKVLDALENLHDLDMGLGTPLGFSPSDHQASHKVWGTQLDATGHYKTLDLE